MKCKVRLFIKEYILTFYNCVYIFVIQLFSNIFRTVLGYSRRGFCRKFQVRCLGNENNFNHRNKRKEILEILRG